MNSQSNGKSTQGGDEFNDTGRVFDRWAKETLFSASHREATLLLDQAVDIHLIHLYRQLNLHHLISQYPTARQLADALHFEKSAYIALEPMLQRLSNRHTFIERHEIAGEPETCFKAVFQPEDSRSALVDLKAKMAALGADYLATLEFLDFGAEHFIRTLKHDHEFMDRVLTGQEKQFNETWHRATNTDPLQDIHGIMGAKVLELLFRQGTVLEVGGGTGNGLRNNLEALREKAKLADLDNYIFTDVSMPFILNTKRELAPQFPDAKCKWQLLNINKDWMAQRIPVNSADYIYGVNAAHIGKETVGFMKQCLQTLKPEGYAVFSERLRQDATQMAPREIVLNQSLYHRTAAIRHPEYRPAHAYLTRKNWLRACEIAGFSQYAVWPSTDSLEDYFPEQYAAVIVARK
jgi:SAM-dependent methyltransferase